MSDVTDLKAEVLLLRRENAELRDEIELNPLECALSEAQALRGQVDALQAENAKLVVKLNSEHIVRQNMEIENTKLQELCAEMFEDCVDECDKWRYTDRMRELGVTP